MARSARLQATTMSTIAFKAETVLERFGHPIRRTPTGEHLCVMANFWEGRMWDENSS